MDCLYHGCDLAAGSGRRLHPSTPRGLWGPESEFRRGPGFLLIAAKDLRSVGAAAVAPIEIQEFNVEVSYASLSCCWVSSRPSVALGIRSSSLVCRGLVSVSVRPERLGAAGTTRDTGHHSRLVPRSYFWPPRHNAVGNAPALRRTGPRDAARLQPYGDTGSQTWQASK